MTSVLKTAVKYITLYIRRKIIKSTSTVMVLSHLEREKILETPSQTKV